MCKSEEEHVTNHLRRYVTVAVLVQCCECVSVLAFTVYIAQCISYPRPCCGQQVY